MPEATSTQPLTGPSVRALAERWYAALDRHDSSAEVSRLLVDEGLELRFPEGTFHGHRGFARWYGAVCRRFFDEEHTLGEVRAEIEGAEARVHVRVAWRARRWNPPAARSEWLGFHADQTWTVVPAEDGGGPLIKTYVCNALEPMPGSAAL
ncbi:nuclear transport factor 2 family protein [Kitasatospora cinereorecta]|uniref:Nuclear transport factor 2 family protein n=1 Tax=Kitasatospora cinereorecta TaxID=285560 RepID=A0ABW0VDF5_9ACTN